MDRWYQFLKEEIAKNHWLFIILAAAFLFRITGIDYGFPFRVNPDEANNVYGALKMIELKTLIPAAHFDIFKNITVYPPYLAYLYIPAFSFLIGLKFLNFLLLGGSFHGLDIFKNFLISDLSPFFSIARMLNVLFGVATVYLVYKIGKNIFKKEMPALFSAAFLALSFLHISFSHWAKHWVPVTFFFALIIYILSLSDDRIKIKNKYFLAFLFAGIGFGVNYQAGISVFFIGLWLIFYEKLNPIKFLKEIWFYEAIGIFIVLSLFAFFLYPCISLQGGNPVPQDRYLVIRHDISVQNGVLVQNDVIVRLTILRGFKYIFSMMFKTEPIFLFFTCLGLVFIFLKNRKFFMPVIGLAVIYVPLYYFIYGWINARYVLMLYPLFAISAGYGLYQILEKKSLKIPGYILAFLIFSFLILLAAKYDYLLLRNDTRVQALDWTENYLPSGSKIIVMADFMRLPPTEKAIDEQRNIDKNSLLDVDLAESVLGENMFLSPKYHSLNLNTVKNHDFLENIGDYAKKNGYDYLIFNPEFAIFEGASDLMSMDGEVIKIFEGFGGGNANDLTWDFAGGVKNILTLKNNGPTILIKKISE